jgi:hypothetical protein
MRLETVGNIRPTDEETWRDKVFLTFDTDWASDEVLAETLELVESAGVAATWFVTHDTPLLERIRLNPLFEIGVHPNFNPLLDGVRGDNGQSDSGEMLKRTMALVPEAVSVRSHSMTQSSRLLHQFKAAGLTHDCNLFVPLHSGVTLQPWKDWTGMIRVPYFWEDDIWILEGRRETPGNLLASPGLKVFDFHPIHVALNTIHMTQYENAKPDFHSRTRLSRHERSGFGGRSFLEDLLTEA